MVFAEVGCSSASCEIYGKLKYGDHTGWVFQARRRYDNNSIIRWS